MSVPVAPGDRLGDTNPTNRGHCLTHGPHMGLLCTPCVVTLPAGATATTPATPAPATGGTPVGTPPSEEPR